MEITVAAYRYIALTFISFLAGGAAVSTHLVPRVHARTPPKVGQNVNLVRSTPREVLMGEPSFVAHSFAALKGYEILALDCTGYTHHERTSVPIITLIVQQNGITDQLLCMSSPAALETAANAQMAKGSKPTLSLVSLPEFDRYSGQPLRHWYMLALRKNNDSGCASRVTLFETANEARAKNPFCFDRSPPAKIIAREVINQWIKDGWQVTRVVGRPLFLQTNSPANATSMAAIFLERQSTTTRGTAVPRTGYVTAAK